MSLSQTSLWTYMYSGSPLGSIGGAETVLCIFLPTPFFFLFTMFGFCWPTWTACSGSCNECPFSWVLLSFGVFWPLAELGTANRWKAVSKSSVAIDSRSLGPRTTAGCARRYSVVSDEALSALPPTSSESFRMSLNCRTRSPPPPLTPRLGDCLWSGDSPCVLPPSLGFECLLELLEALLFFFLALWCCSPPLTFPLCPFFLFWDAALVSWAPDGVLSWHKGEGVCGLWGCLLLLLLMGLVALVVANWYSWLLVSWWWGGRELLEEFSADELSKWQKKNEMISCYMC